MRLRLRVLGAVAALGAFAAPAGAQIAREGEARGYLEAGLAAHAEAGFRRDPTTPDLVAPLRLDRPFLWAIYLREGVRYRVYAACDSQCSDIDMEIYAADGNLAGRDTETNDTPFVEIIPRQSARHYARLWLYQCAEEPCVIAARVVSAAMPPLGASPGAPSGAPSGASSGAPPAPALSPAPPLDGDGLLGGVK